MLVNNAGPGRGRARSRARRSRPGARHLDVNATGAFLCTRAVLGGMIERGDGRIVTVASTAGLRGARYTAAYTAAKHAAVGLMRAVAAEVAGTGVTANAVCPGWVRTDMMRRAVERIADTTDRDEEQAEAALVAQMPLGRALEPEEVAVRRRVPRLARGGGDQRPDARARRGRIRREPVPRLGRLHRGLEALRLRRRGRRRDGHLLAARTS